MVVPPEIVKVKIRLAVARLQQILSIPPDGDLRSSLQSVKARPRTSFLILPPDIRNYIYDLAIFSTPSISPPRPVQLITIGSPPFDLSYPRHSLKWYPNTFHSQLILKKRKSTNHYEHCNPLADGPARTIPHILFASSRQSREETCGICYSSKTFVVHLNEFGISRTSKSGSSP